MIMLDIPHTPKTTCVKATSNIEGVHCDIQWRTVKYYSKKKKKRAYTELTQHTSKEICTKMRMFLEPHRAFSLLGGGVGITITDIAMI